MGRTIFIRICETRVEATEEYDRYIADRNKSYYWEDQTRFTIPKFCDRQAVCNVNDQVREGVYPLDTIYERSQMILSEYECEADRITDTPDVEELFIWIAILDR